MHRELREHRERFDREVAVRDRVEAVARSRCEPKLLGECFAIDRVARPGQCARAQRADVDARQCSVEPEHVPLKHLDVRQTPVPERHGLGRLEVRVGGERVGAVRLGLCCQGLCDRDRHPPNLCDGVACPEAKVGGDLIVSAAPRVELFTETSELLNEFLLDPGVHILRPGLNGRVRDRLGFFAQRFECVDELSVLARREHTARAERPGPGDRAADVLLNDAPIDRERVVGCPEEFVGAGAFVATAPHPAAATHLAFPPVSKFDARRSVSEKRRMKPLASAWS